MFKIWYIGILLIGCCKTYSLVYLQGGVGENLNFEFIPSYPGMFASLQTSPQSSVHKLKRFQKKSLVAWPRHPHNNKQMSHLQIFLYVFVAGSIMKYYFLVGFFLTKISCGILLKHMAATTKIKNLMRISSLQLVLMVLMTARMILILRGKWLITQVLNLPWTTWQALLYSYLMI